MSPVDVALLSACAVLLALALGAALVATVRVRRLGAALAVAEATLQRLTEQVHELGRREAAREAAEAQATEAREAEWVITYDGEDPRGRGPETGERRTVATAQVVGTAFGEPLIKVAALSHGVRQALREEKRAHLAYQVRREYRRRRRESRARARAMQRGATGRTATRPEDHVDSSSAHGRTAQ